ncbi:hypothetical protein THAOC_00933, partial [Thalassiosira oceanica]
MGPDGRIQGKENRPPAGEKMAIITLTSTGPPSGDYGPPNSKQQQQQQQAMQYQSDNQIQMQIQRTPPHRRRYVGDGAAAARDDPGVHDGREPAVADREGRGGRGVGRASAAEDVAPAPAAAAQHDGNGLRQGGPAAPPGGKVAQSLVAPQRHGADADADASPRVSPYASPHASPYSSPSLPAEDGPARLR